MSRWRSAGSAAIVITISQLAVATAQQGPPPAPVVVAEATRTTLAPLVSISGTIVSRFDSRLASEVTGRLIEIVDVGTVVARGDPIARLENTALELRREEYAGVVTREQARLTFLEPEVERLQRLAEENNAAKSRLDQTRSDRDVARGDLAVAHARLKQVDDQLAKTTVRAPFDGVVTERVANLGEMINEFDQVVRLVSTESIEVTARAPLNAVAFLSPNSELKIHNDYRNGIGKVRTITTVGDPRSHMFELRIDVAAEAWIVGESVRVDVPTAAPREVLSVHRDALVFRRDGAFVYRISPEQVAERVTVNTGASDGTLTEIDGDLAAGDLVVVRGAERLRPGQTVNITGRLAGGASAEPVAGHSER